MFTVLFPLRLAGVLFAVCLGACASAPVSLADKDTSGLYDGAWTGSVAGPRATRVSLPGKWYMRCDWQPFDVHLQVEDGLVQLDDFIDKTPISAAGEFRFDVISGEAGMDRGVMHGNGKFVDVVSGSLAADRSTGSYSQYVTSINGGGCSATITFRRHLEPVNTPDGPAV